MSFRPGSLQRGMDSVVDQIQEIAAKLKSQPDAKLSELASSLAARLAHTEAPNREIQTSAFAMMSEAIRRVHGFELYHVQIAAERFWEQAIGSWRRAKDGLTVSFRKSHSQAHTFIRLAR